MLQPFEPFRLMFIEKLIAMKARYLVSQTYTRATGHAEARGKTMILLTDYDHPGSARIHLNAVKHDRYASIVDLENPEHKKKLTEMLSPASKYLLFWSVVKSKKQLEHRINAQYRDNMRRYIEQYTNWRVGRDLGIRPSVEVTFGELFIILKYSGQTIRLKFEEIERV